MSNSTGDNSRSFSSDNNTGEEEVHQHHHHQHQQQQQQQEQQNHFHASLSASLERSNSTGSNSNSQQQQQDQKVKKKRNLPGTPDPTAEVVALSPTTLMATNRFVCEICNKGFQRDQNLQLHRRGHNLPWKLKQRTSSEVRKKVYICPETTCVHHNPARALGDLTGIKKHFCRKHGEKKWKCDKCSKKYAVQSDWKAHSKTCGTREYKCDCGTIFSRRDSFITHRAFCDALAEENNKVNQVLMPTNMDPNLQGQVSELISSIPINTSSSTNTSMNDQFNNSETNIKNPLIRSLNPHDLLMPIPIKSSLNMAAAASSLFGTPRTISSSSPSLQLNPAGNTVSSTFDGLHDSSRSSSRLQILAGSAHMSATALLQKAAQMGATASSNINSPMMQKSFGVCGMAGPPAYARIQASYNDHQVQSQIADQAQLVGIDHGGPGGFINQLFHKSPQDNSSQFFDSPPGSAGTDHSSMNDNIGMFSGLFMSGNGGGDETPQHGGFLKSMEHENSSSTNSSPTNMLQGRHAGPGLGLPGSTSRNLARPSRFGSNGSSTGTGAGVGDMMTVDFLGIGGSRSANNLHEHHQQQQQQQQEGMEFEARLHSYHQQVIQHGQAAMEKPMWDA